MLLDVKHIRSDRWFRMPMAVNGLVVESFEGRQMFPCPSFANRSEVVI